MKKHMKIGIFTVAVLLVVVFFITCNDNITPDITNSDATAFIDAVRALPDIEDVKVSDEGAVNAALAKYEALSDRDKGLSEVKTAKEIKDGLRAKIAELIDLAAAADFIAAVNKLPAAEALTLSDRGSIREAEAIYNNLSNSGRGTEGVPAAKTAFDPLLARLNALLSGAYLYNPYRFVDWSRAMLLETQTHIHTQVSDGSDLCQLNVDKYSELGFDLIVFTDHHPWPASWGPKSYNVGYGDIYVGLDGPRRNINDRKNLIMSDGVEYSQNAHVISMFNTSIQRTADTTVSAMVESGITHSEANQQTGRWYIPHPGRTVADGGTLAQIIGRLNGTMSGGRTAFAFANSDFVHKENLGFGVYNQHDRYPHDRVLWDRVQLETLPRRPIWAIADDDNHGMFYDVNDALGIQSTSPGNSYGYAVTRALVTERTEDAFREALEVGAFFASSFNKYNPAQLDARPGESRWDYIPTVTRITTDTTNGYIILEAENYTSIRWITGCYDNGSKIIEGEESLTFNYFDNFDNINKFVRPMLYFHEGAILVCETIVQPFAIGEFDPDSGYFAFFGPQ